MNAARFLAEIIAQGGPVYAARYQTRPEFKALTSHGFFADAGVVQSVLCDDCSSPHDACVDFEDGQYGIRCPDLGFITKSRSDLLAVQANVPKLVAQLAHTLGCKRIKSTPIFAETRRVGAIPHPQADVMVYFHPVLRDGSDLHALLDALARESKAQFGVVLTAEGTLSTPGFATVLLEDCVTFNEETGRFLVDANLPMLAGVPFKNTGGRPREYEAKLAKVIEARTASGRALPGQNEEARAVLADFKSDFPDTNAPALSTIKRRLSEL
ncbi:MAG: hypothetical protein MK098_06185 [Marinovum sp.]|nr:hypothetical protein [Marinovum sp.]